MENSIKIKGARVNNLKNINVEIPLNSITCVTGPSGSGKSSLVWHTIFNESKRRFLNSFPNYMKFFMDRPTAADVDEIHPILPVFGLKQMNPIVGSRSVVGDLIGLTDKLQVLFYYGSEQFCPKHNLLLEAQSLDLIVEKLLDELKSNNVDKLYFFLTQERYQVEFGTFATPARAFSYDKNQSIEFDCDSYSQYWEYFRVKVGSSKSHQKITDSIKKLKNIGDIYYFHDQLNAPIKINFSEGLKCPKCKFTGTKLELNNFSPFNAVGACKKCNGHGAILVQDLKKIVPNENAVLADKPIAFLGYKRTGYYEEFFYSEIKKSKISLTKPIKSLPKKFWEILESGQGKWPGVSGLFKKLEKKKYKKDVRILLRKYQIEKTCDFCQGSRMSPTVSHYRILDSNIQNSTSSTIKQFSDIVQTWPSKKNVGMYESSLNKLKNILITANGLGIGHLDISRKTKSLTSGEYQRCLLVKYLAYEGTNSLFIFDEPSLGLDSKDQKKLIQGFEKLKSQGNTVLLVDHSRYLAEKSDQIINMGPGAGFLGGEILDKDPTDKNISKENIKFPKKSAKKISVKGMQIYNLPKRSIDIPLRSVSWVTGPAGSGKTAFIIKVFANEISKLIGKGPITSDEYNLSSLTKYQDVEDVLIFSAQHLNSTSRSSFGSSSGFGPIVRKHFANLPVSKSMGLSDAHFSPNSQLGMCHECEGRGFKVLEMQFLEDVVLECEACSSLGIDKMYSSIHDGQISVFDAFMKPFNEVVERLHNFKMTPKYKRIHDFIHHLRLDYLSLSRSVKSLSGGERQRLSLLSRLDSKTKNSLIVFENLSFGLSDNDILGLGEIFIDLICNDNTIIIIDQNTIFKHLAQYKLAF